MSDTNISQVLAQMRVVAARSQGLSDFSGLGAEAVKETGDSGFSELLKKSINAVNDTQKQAGKLSEAFQAGDPNVDLTEVMVTMQKSKVAFQAVTQVRNKLVEAYQDVMRMNI